MSNAVSTDSTLKHTQEQHHDANHDANPSAHTQHTEHKLTEMDEILGSTHDHSGFTWSNFHLFDLPFIFVDNGLHIYGSEHSLNESGKFKMIEEHGHHKVVKVVDGKLTKDSPAIDLSITNFIAFQFLAVLAVSFIFMKASSSYKKAKVSAPKGLANGLEAIMLFIRDEVVRPNLPNSVIADRYMPFFMVLFFFIAGMNYLGMLPGGHTATSAFWINGAISIVAILFVNIVGIKEGGFGHYLHHLATGGAPWYMIPIMLPLEVLSNFVIKPFVLTMRLFANMTAGHLILAALTGVIIGSKMIFAAIPIVPFSVFIMVLEVLVCFLQAFVFTMLTCIFTGLAIGEHPKGAHH
jgi:F-type H+-transporting ATPase subunit a